MHMADMEYVKRQFVINFVTYIQVNNFGFISHLICQLGTDAKVFLTGIQCVHFLFLLQIVSIHPKYQMHHFMLQIPSILIYSVLSWPAIYKFKNAVH